MKWFVKQEAFVTIFGVYSLVGVLALLLWWVIYQAVLTRDFSVREAVFGENPNAAVALDLVGGMLATGVLFYFTLRFPSSSDFWQNTWNVAKNLAGLLLLLTVLRLLLAALLRVWFRNKKDALGEIVSLNNELFEQRNMAASIFSNSLYLILVAGMLQLEFGFSYQYQVAGILNMLGIWMMGVIVVVLHSILFLGFGVHNHILHECFHDNNPAAASSLLGLTGGFLLLSYRILNQFKPEMHIFNTPHIWFSVGAMLVGVLVARAVLQGIVLATTRINLSRELVIRDNLAWGVLDGGLILTICLVLVSFL